jgi:hypothetical protein
MQARFEEGVWQLQQSLHVLREELSEHQVSRPFPSWDRSILTEIYLCHACSCQEMLRTDTAGQEQPPLQPSAEGAEEEVDLTGKGSSVMMGEVKQVRGWYPPPGWL